MSSAISKNALDMVVIDIILIIRHYNKSPGLFDPPINLKGNGTANERQSTLIMKGL